MRKWKDVWLWHRCLGHGSFGYIKKIFTNVFDQINISNLYCDVSKLVNSHMFHFSLISNKISFPFMIIYFDAWDSFKVIILGGSMWFIMFIDNSTQKTCLCLMRSKSEFEGLFQKIEKWLRFNTISYGIDYAKISHSQN